MKRILVIAVLSLAINVVKGQLAQWIIPPAYDRIDMASGADLIMADSSGVKTLWTLDGRRLATTKNWLYPFAEGFAVSTKGNSNQIDGFYDTKGHFTRLDGCQTVNEHPYFAGGHLLVKSGYYFRYSDTKGQLAEGKYTKAYPFANGYASCFTYTNLLKNKGPHGILLTSDLEQVAFAYDGHLFDEEDIEFTSSVNDEYVGVVIVKRRVYLFNGKDKSLTPVMANQGGTDLKNQAKLEDELAMCLIKETDSTQVLTAKCGKVGMVKIRFNDFLVPLSIKTPDKELTWKPNVKPGRSVSSPLKTSVTNGRTGLYWKDREVLPPQLDKVESCIDNIAFACMSGKYGALKVYQDETFQITINKGNPVNFRHQKFETTLRVDLPHQVSAKDCTIEMADGAGCEIDFTSCEKKNTEFGNYLQYNSVLNIPDDLPDEMSDGPQNTITYPTTILYNGLRSPQIPVKVKAWHHKYFNADVYDSDISITDGLLSFVLNIFADRYPNEPVYPMTVLIDVGDSLLWDLEKVSESRYKCKVWTIPEGTTNIVVQVKELGCPPASFNFEVTYVKPTPKVHNKPAVKENIVIKKKPRPVSKPTTAPPTKPQPHLDI